ncbi:MAG TPA: hemolysin III family protein [Clostridiales bacterium]|nr:hemolysin III family protein [Clostridiales bacterium]
MNKALTRIKDPASALTHFSALIFILLFTIPLLTKSLTNPGYDHFFAVLIFIIGIILLYTASTVYHTFDISETINQRLRKFDHMAIFLLIAGTYTPICLIALRNTIGPLLMLIVWSIAIIGIIITAFWVNGPKWISSVIYIVMGWVCVLAFVPLIDSLELSAFIWLFTGGIIYTIGGVIYALKLKILNKRFPHFGSHEIFHVFVMLGSLCHFILIYKYISVMPI